MNEQTFQPDMVSIPSGPFLMGTKAEERDELFLLMAAEKKGISTDVIMREFPQCEIYLQEYRITRYPITNAQYFYFIFETGHPIPEGWTNYSFPRGEENNPVTCITWYDANLYCHWLSEKTKNNYRLPTEAEWEKAARGVSGFRYPWGNNWDPSLCNNIENGARNTSIIGNFSPDGDSIYGCGDMIGNVWEWCSSIFSKGEMLYKYPYNSSDGREDLNYENCERVLRGGSFLNGRGRARCSYRGHGVMSHKNNHTGFRCVIGYGQ